ncbi:GNAT family N-acetyltransferase [Leptospira noguchii]|uniref:GNAT family N-acetyltransferase n=1 Tax=Leptospira noguchii TaxID=28182 RepID=UPI000248AAA0|nr:GNAT family N-acetyltransferase [Leptospira noguchii]EKR71276.1 acetyltransferase, GNAT family [Leptospira noguchii str. 2006001870]EMS81851.1 acetyltransferase, GNAT family [Leptospira noguchii str. Hook]
MKILIDTNILIPLEPVYEKDIEIQRQTALEFISLCRNNNIDIYLHPAGRKDIENDQDSIRKQIRIETYKKYKELKHPPEVTKDMLSVLGNPKLNPHDNIDIEMLATVYYNAIDYFVSDDNALRKKAKSLCVQDRVLSLNEILDLLLRLFPDKVLIPDIVKRIPVYSLNDKDPIFESLRESYPNFDTWLQKCKREHREAIIIQRENALAAICIFAEETKDQIKGLKGKILKLNTFKVSAKFSGYKLGELLLKSVIRIARHEKFAHLYLTTYEHQIQLINFLEDFGFRAIPVRNEREELVFVKNIIPIQSSSRLTSLEFQIHFGPGIEKFDEVSIYLVPIQPQYSRLLFRETEKQGDFFTYFLPVENTIRKAYLCHSHNKQLVPGDILLFYRSEDVRSLVAVGICEFTFRSKDSKEIIRKIGQRTVYSFSEIENLTKKEVLVVLFRESRILEQPVHYNELSKMGIVKGPIQSIQKIRQEQLSWLIQRITE